MTTLADIALTVAKQLSRASADGTAILDLENEIKDEIKNAVRFYNRRVLHLMEFRGGELTTSAGATWYSTMDITNGDGDQDKTDRTTLDVNSIINIHYMRENPGASGLNEPLSEVPYRHFERMFEGSTPQGQPEFFTRYAGQIGIWPTPAATHTIYWSGIVKPVVPSDDADTSVWFEQANEMIEASAARRVCSKYLRDPERAGGFAAEEKLAYDALKAEHVSKVTTGRLRSHD